VVVSAAGLFICISTLHDPRPGFSLLSMWFGS
jgi:hypothetical protein